MKTNKVGKNFDHKLDCGQILWPIGSHGIKSREKVIHLLCKFGKLNLLKDSVDEP